MKFDILPKVILLVVALVLMVGISGSFYVLREQTVALEKSYFDKGTTAASWIESSLGVGENYSGIEIQNVVSKFLLLNPDIVNVSILKIDGSEIEAVYSYLGTAEDEKLEDDNDEAYIEKAFNQNTSFEYVGDHNGREVIDIFSPYSISGRLTGVIDVQIDRKPLLDSLQNQISGVFLIMMVLTVLFVGGLSMLLHSIVTIPLNSLVQAVKKIELGDFSVEVKPMSNDEIGFLAIGLQSMVTKLRESYAELEGKVNERTKELKDQKEGVEKLVKERTGELEDERSKLVASVESMYRGYFLIDLEGKIILSNSSLIKILNLKVAPDDIEVVDNTLGENVDLKKAYEECKKDRKWIFINDKEFGSRIVSIIVNPVVRGGSVSTGELLGVLGVIEDVTDRKMLERSRDEFFSIASHELRTPLTAIRGNASMIKDMILPKLNDPELPGMIEDIHEGSVRLIGIVNDFLELSRLEQGKIEYKKEIFEIREPLQLVVNQLIKTAEDKGISLLLGKVSDAKVNTDKGKFIEILTNLIGNGIKYTDKGEVEIRADDDKNKVIISIKDTGRGIPASNQGLLFRKFQQASNNLYTRDTAKSTGLGLYISRMMAEGMGGKIYLLKSEENKGSEFAFELPLV